jgi:hypothetical protein
VVTSTAIKEYIPYGHCRCYSKACAYRNIRNIKRITLATKMVFKACAYALYHLCIAYGDIV